MKKHSMILALIVALTMAFVFVGCKNSTTPEPEEGTELVLYESGAFKTGYEATVTGGTGAENAVIEFTNKIDTTGKTKVFIKLTTPTDYCGGSVEGNETMTSSTWNNNQMWSGFTKVGGETTDTFSANFTFVEGGTTKTIGGFMKICIEKTVLFSKVAKIWIE